MSSSSSNDTNLSTSSFQETLSDQSVLNYISMSKKIMEDKIRDLEELEKKKQASFEEAINYNKDVRLEFDHNAYPSFDLNLQDEDLVLDGYWRSEKRGGENFSVHHTTNPKRLDVNHEVKTFSQSQEVRKPFFTPIDYVNDYLFFGEPITTTARESEEKIIVPQTFDDLTCIHEDNNGVIVQDYEDKELDTDAEVVHMGRIPYAVATLTCEQHYVFVVRNMRGGEKRKFIAEKESSFMPRIFLLNNEFFFVQYGKTTDSIRTRIVHAISGECIHELEEFYDDVVVCDYYVALISRHDGETTIKILIDEEDA